MRNSISGLNSPIRCSPKAPQAAGLPGEKQEAICFPRPSGTTVLQEAEGAPCARVQLHLMPTPGLALISKPAIQVASEL